MLRPADCHTPLYHDYKGVQDMGVLSWVSQNIANSQTRDSEIAQPELLNSRCFGILCLGSREVPPEMHRA